MNARFLLSGSVIVGAMLAAVELHADPAVYDTPEAAAEAVALAITANDPDALLRVFGEENRDIVFTGDDTLDRAIWGRFIDQYRLGNRVDLTDPDRATLLVGWDDWPFPAPIVKSAAGWHFDGAMGREEVVLRRIGLNEIDVIDALRAGVELQARYRQVDHDGDGVLEFASSILSTPGARDGLYWPDEPGTEPSPIGPLLARAAADGVNVDGSDAEAEPYLGYYFRILTGQGDHAPGGALSYLKGGNMIAGHAFLAYPADYGETGVMSFMVGENGVVYEADLGENTPETAGAIENFDPGEGWTPVEE